MIKANNLFKDEDILFIYRGDLLRLILLVNKKVFNKPLLDIKQYELNSYEILKNIKDDGRYEEFI